LRQVKAGRVGARAGFQEEQHHLVSRHIACAA